FQQTTFLGQLVDDVAVQHRLQLMSRCRYGIGLIHQPSSLIRCHRLRLREASTPKSLVRRSNALVSGLLGASLNRSTPRLRLCRRSLALGGKTANSGRSKLFSSVLSSGTTP